MNRIKLLQRLFLLFLLVGCSQNDLSENSLKTLEIGEYRVQVPNNFILIEQQGYDSMVGKIEGSGISMSFDYGIYTSPEKNVSEEDYRIINENTEGIRKQLLIAKNPQKEDTSIHISFSGNSETNNPPPLKIWSTDLTAAQQELVVTIFNSLTVERQLYAQ